MAMESEGLSKKNIVAVFAAFFVYGLASASDEFRVLFMQNQGLSAAECGYVLATAGILQAIARPLSGVVADKLRSRKWVFIIAGIAWIVFLILLLLIGAGKIGTFVLCAGIIPLMNVCSVVSSGMLEADGVEATQRVKKLDYSIIRVFTSISYCLVNFLYTPIVNRFGVGAPYVCTIIFAGAGLIIGRGLRCFETQSGEKKVREKLELTRIFKNYYLVVFVLLTFILTLGTNTSSYLVYLIEEIGMDSSVVGLASGIRVVGELIMMPLVPLIKKKVSLPLMQPVAACFLIIQMLIFIFCKNPTVILCAVALNGLAGGITLSTTVVYLRQMAPGGLVNTTLSLNAIAQGLGGVIMSFIGGLIVEKLGIFSLYKFALAFLVIWMALYFSAWFIGKAVLKKTPPVEMFKR